MTRNFRRYLISKDVEVAARYSWIELRPFLLEPKEWEKHEMPGHGGLRMLGRGLQTCAPWAMERARKARSTHDPMKGERTDGEGA